MRDAMSEIQGQLQILRPLLMTQGARAFLQLFDELMEQREYGLALHAVCDYALTPGSPVVSTATLDQIYRLHEAMKIDDHCVEDLQNRKLKL